ncbi:MAG: hypothetical protein NVSMB18_35680 [Acetobacteraceae bacterium]
MAALLALASAWGVGFARFNAVVRRATAPVPVADGIVVLTGGAERIETALRLLADGRAPVLLVSGVGRGAELAEMARHLGPETGPLSSRVTLGRTATSTLGNAAETAAWVHAHAIRRLIVVTASYHMPRALLEIGHALPGVALFPAAVQPPAMRGPTDFGTVRLLASEYDKLLAVRLGLTRLIHAGEGP